MAITLNSAFEVSGPEFRLDQGWYIALTATQVYTDRFILIGQDQFPGGAGGANQFNWPVPPGPQPRYATYWTADSFKLPLQAGVSVPFNQTDWPVPKGYVRNQDLGFTPPGTAFLPTPLAITFSIGTEIGGPYFPPPRSINGITWIQSGFAVLTAPAKPSIQQTDWPNPRGPKPLVFDWADSFKLPLQAGTSAPSAQFDWPVPKGPTPAIMLRTWTDSFKLPLQQNLPSGTQFDFPNPRGTLRNQDFNIPQVNLQLQVSTTLPFNETDWPVPRGPARYLQDWKDSFKLPLTTVAPPFTQYDFPNPRGYQRSIDLLTVAQSTFGTDLGLPAGIAQYDWPIPRGFSRPPVDWIQGRNCSLFAAAAAATLPLTVFNQYDWPNPKGYRPLVYDWSDSFKLELQAGPSSVPAHQLDWPNPRGPIPANQLKVWSNSINLSFTGIVVPKQTDWPVPQGYRRSIDLYNWTDRFKLPLQTIIPKNQFDWPNPRGFARLVEYPIGGSDNVCLQTPIASIGLVFIAKDFPNPIQPRPKQVDFQNTSFLNLSSGFIPPPPPPPPPPVINKPITTLTVISGGQGQGGPAAGSGGGVSPSGGSGQGVPGQDP